ncbi:MAG TPA: hypothetical protein VNJ51_10925 [Candidatus Dormibacteraeota bacterium]|nr:hypothetical protein [Candidatus Dormibacteraeota bacterium]
MNERDRYQPLSPGGLAAAFAVLGLLGALSMGMPFMFGAGSMMGGMMGPYGGYGGYPNMGWGGFGLFGLIWIVAIAALGGAVVAWVYNAMIGARTARPTDAAGRPLPPTTTGP